MLKKKILLFGPKLNKKLPTLYGGGVGGYITNFRSYLSEIKIDEFKYIPSYLSIKGEYKIIFMNQ